MQHFNNKKNNNIKISLFWRCCLLGWGGGQMARMGGGWGVAGFTSVISKMLSGSRLPPPTFLVQVTVPLFVTDMMRLATEQAFSCSVASTTCRWPTCREQFARGSVEEVKSQKVHMPHSFCYCSFREVGSPCTTWQYKERSLHWVWYNHRGHRTARFPSLLLRQSICELWEVCRWGDQKTQLSFNRTKAKTF